MKLFKFELKKVWKQKKLIILFLIVTCFMLFQYLYNASQQDAMVKQLYEETEPLQIQVDIINRDLEEKQLNNVLDEVGQEQKIYINEMKSALYSWRSSITMEKWHESPAYEEEFLNSLQNYLQTGGEFSELDGVNLEFAIQKNRWMLDNNLVIENEVYPISPHLFLKQSSDWLFSMIGIILLILFFGNILSIEKEQHTWRILRTQPIPKWKIILVKYVTLLFILLFYTLLVIIFAVFTPLLLNDHSLILNYPQVLVSDEEVIVISILHDLLRTVVLFVGTGFITFSLLLLFSALLKQTFATLMTSLSVLLIGYVWTSAVPALQKPVNIFQHLRMDQILLAPPKPTDWMYPLFAIIWSGIFIMIMIIFPEREPKFLQSKSDRRAFHSGKTYPKRRKYWSVIVFEWRKLIRRGIVKQIIAILFLLILFGYTFLAKTAVEMESNYLEQLKADAYALEKEMIPMLETELAYDHEELENTNDSYDKEMIEAYIKGTHAAIELYQKQLTKINKGLEGYELGDWDSFYEQQLFRIRLYNGDFDDELGYISHHFEQPFQYEVSLAEKNWLIENDIQPIFPGEFRLTIHDQWPENPQGEAGKKLWEENNHKLDHSGLYSLYHFFEHHVYVVVVVLFLFVLGTGFAGERGKKNTIYFLQTQPVSNRILFLGKAINSSLVTIISILSLVFFIIVIGTIFNRFGDWNYPILHYDTQDMSTSPDYAGILTEYQDYGFHFIPLGHYLIQCIILLLLVSLFIIVLANFLSLFMKSAFSNLILTFIICISGCILSSEYLASLTYLSPFTYFRIFQVTNGEIATMINQSMVHFNMGIVVLIISSFLIIVAGYFILKIRIRARTKLK